ncbi:MAG: DMT family transporter [Oscillospiraceae bacterium]|nr:DMT family transporter [Oscillospiraceae bacterium]
MAKQLRGNLLLLFAALIWGVAFVAQSAGMEFLGPFSFQFVRFMLGGVVLLPVIWLLDRRKKDGKTYWSRWKDPRLLKSGLLCGVVLFFATNLQQLSLLYTSAGKAGFLTAMYIVMVPLLGLFFRRRVGGKTWLGVLLAICGLYLLSFSNLSGVNRGDLYALGGAFAFACQITAVDCLAKDLDAVRLNCLQTLICGVLCGVVMAFTEKPTVAAVLDCWLPICYAGVFSLAVGYTLQILCQQQTGSAVAALLMSMESVFAALAGWLILHEKLSGRELWGCALVFLAAVLAQLPAKKAGSPACCIRKK